MNWTRSKLAYCTVLGILLLQAIIPATTYEVGPGKPLVTPNEVPWEKLATGDEVLIHWRTKPYQCKWVICRQGTQKHPIVIRGVNGPQGQQTVISAADATTRSQLDYWSDERSLIKIGGASKPTDAEPAYIVIKNLHLRDANEGNHFTDNKGRRTAYTHHAAGIYIEKGHHITLRDCTLSNNGNGLMTSHKSRNILVERCHIHSNGNRGSIYHHNVYTESLNITFRNNRLCPLRRGARGNNLKDRSAGLKVIENTIHGGNRQLDLVDAEDSEILRNHPNYSQTLVDKNLLIERIGDGNKQVVHFGGDSGKTNWYRRELIFRNNIVITYRKDATTLFRMATKDQHVLCENNHLHHAADPRNGLWHIVDQTGNVQLKNNGITGKWKPKGSLFGRPNIKGKDTFYKGKAPYHKEFPTAQIPYHLRPCEHHRH